MVDCISSAMPRLCDRTPSVKAQMQQMQQGWQHRQQGAVLGVVQ